MASFRTGEPFRTGERDPAPIADHGRAIACPEDRGLSNTDVTLRRNVVIPLRDGVQTTADVWHAAQSAATQPAILVRTPYDKDGLLAHSPIDPRLAAEHGFAMVIQDVRGRGRAEGAFEPFVHEREDGYDSVEWVARQPWCDGRVVMCGASYVGATQWLAAAARPPSLRAIAPLISADGYGEGWSFRSGVRELGFLSAWIAGSLNQSDPAWMDRIEHSFTDHEALAELAPWSVDWFREPAGSDYWAARSATGERPVMAVAVLSVGGWYDTFLAGTLRAHAASVNPVDRLIIGPWGHDSQFSHLVGERNLGIVGSRDAFGLGRRILGFYQAVLDGRPPELAPVTAYLLGARRWIELEAWPPPGTVEHTLPLGAGSFVVDPDHLPPALGGRGLLSMIPGAGYGPRDQRALAARDDVLVLPAAPLTEGSLLAGRVRAELAVRADGGATRDWAVTLCVAEPGGALINVCEGIARCPVDAEAVSVDLGDLFIELRPEERLMCLVAGGSWPRWEPPSTPGRQHVTHGSSLVLSTLPGADR